MEYYKFTYYRLIKISNNNKSKRRTQDVTGLRHLKLQCHSNIQLLIKYTLLLNLMGKKRIIQFKRKIFFVKQALKQYSTSSPCRAAVKLFIYDQHVHIVSIFFLKSYFRSLCPTFVPYALCAVAKNGLYFPPSKYLIGPQDGDSRD